MPVWICVCVCAFTYTHTHIHAHTYIHTHIDIKTHKKTEQLLRCVTQTHVSTKSWLCTCCRNTLVYMKWCVLIKWCWQQTSCAQGRRSRSENGRVVVQPHVASVQVEQQTQVSNVFMHICMSVQTCVFTDVHVYTHMPVFNAVQV